MVRVVAQLASHLYRTYSTSLPKTPESCSELLVRHAQCHSVRNLVALQRILAQMQSFPELGASRNQVCSFCLEMQLMRFFLLKLGHSEGRTFGSPKLVWICLEKMVWFNQRTPAIAPSTVLNMCQEPCIKNKAHLTPDNCHSVLQFAPLFQGTMGFYSVTLLRISLATCCFLRISLATCYVLLSPVALIPDQNQGVRGWCLWV